MRTRVTAAPGRRAWTVERVSWLTPYTADGIAQEARRAGPGARLEVLIPISTKAEDLAAVHSFFARPRNEGIEVVVRREGEDA